MDEVAEESPGELIEALSKGVKDVVITNEERLEVANLALTAELQSRQKYDLLLRVQEQDAKLAKTQERIRTKQRELSEKYGIDFSKQQVEVDTGKVIPAPRRHQPQ